MFFRKKKKGKEMEVKACFSGKIVPLEKVNDPMFADRVMGDGIAVEPSDGILYAPVTGIVSAVFDTKHAVGFTLENGAEVLMHIGIDTVELEGNGFDLNISTGSKVTAGDEIGNVDLGFIKSREKEVTTPLLLTNMDQYQVSFLKKQGEVIGGEVLYTISRK